MLKCGTIYNVFTVAIFVFFQPVRVFKNGLLKRKFEPKRKEVIGNGKIYLIKNFIIFTSLKYYLCV